MMKKITFASTIALLLIPALALPALTTTKGKVAPSSVSSGPSFRQHSAQSQLSNGTPVVLTIIAAGVEEGRAQAAMSAALARAQTFERELFAPGGLEAQLASLPRGQAIALSPDAFALISRAVEIAARTEGWFDIAGPSPANWFTQRDWRRIRLDPAAHTLSFKSDGMQLDLRRIALGYEADLCMEEISRHGFANAMVEVGPVRRVSGRDLFTPWSIQIGFGGDGSQYAYRAFTYALTNIATATVTGDGLGSGLIDPRSKKVVSDTLMKSITTLANDATTATAYALASYTLGPRIGMRFVEAHPEVKGVLVDNDGKLFASTGLGATNTQPPAESQPAGFDGGPNDLKQKQVEEERDL